LSRRADGRRVRRFIYGQTRKEVVTKLVELRRRPMLVCR
jgi:hypothetical protein